MVRLMSFVVIGVLCSCFIPRITSAGQISVPDMAAVTAAGSIHGRAYVNSYFGLSVEVPEELGELQLNPYVPKDGKGATLLAAGVNASAWERKKGLTIAADVVSHYPNLVSAEQYVRSWRHIWERQGEITIEKEHPVNIAGHEFSAVKLKTVFRDGVRYETMASTMTKGYIVGFDVAAASESALDQLQQNVFHNVEFASK